VTKKVVGVFVRFRALQLMGYYKRARNKFHANGTGTIQEITQRLGRL
jgi:hypothetical protein